MLPFVKYAWVLDLVQTVLRSWWTIVAGISLGLAASLLALQYMPKKYQATTKIWIAQPQLPESVAPTTVQEDMTRRLSITKAAVLDQPYMVELIERTFGLPETEEQLRGLMTLLRARVGVNLTSHRRAGLLMFSISYRGDTNPQRAANVVNTLTKLYISQNEDFRASQAQRNSETLASLAEAAKPEFEAIDRELSEFRTRHRFETVADRPANQRLLDAAHRDLELIKTRRAVLEAQLRGFEVQLAQARMRAARSAEEDAAIGLSIDPWARRIAQLQRELAELRISYSEVHPSYVKKKRELEDLLREAKNREGTVDMEATDYVDPAVAALETQINVVRQEMAMQDADEARLRKDTLEFERRIAVASDVQRQLDQLVERHTYVRDRYHRLQKEADNAKASVELEEGRLTGQRMDVLEYATVPTKPYAPDPLRVHVLGLALGCLLFVGPLLARNLLNPVILSQEGLRSLSAAPVLIGIPSLHGDRGVVVRRFVKNLALAGLFGAALVAAKLLLVVN